MDKILLIYASHIDLHEEGLDVPLELIEVDESIRLYGLPVVRFRLPPGHPHIEALGTDEDGMHAMFCYVDVDVEAEA